MKNKNLSELSLELLLKEKKQTLFLIGVLVGVLSASLVLGIVQMFYEKKFSILIILPFAFLPILVAHFKTLQKIKAEISSRNDQQQNKIQ